MEYLEIREFGEIITGKTPKTDVLEYWGGDTPFITPTDIPSFDTKYLHSTERTISELGVTKQKNTLLPADTLCVSCIATIGKMCLTRKPSVTNQQINSIKVNDRFNPHYLLYLFRYYLPYLQLIGGGTGSGTPIISKGKFSKLKYPVHQDLEIQNKIAEFLSTYDELIENNNKRIKLLKQMAENLYKEWFVRFRFPGYENAEFENGIPVGWKVKRLGDELTIKRGGSPRPIQDYIIENGLKWLKISDATKTDNPFIFNIEESIKEEGLKKTVYRKAGSLVLSNSATPGLPRILALDTCIHDGWLYFENQKLSNEFLFLFFNHIHPQLVNKGNGAVFTNLKTDILKKYSFVRPADDILSQFDAIVQPLFKQIYSITQQNNNLIKQRDLLLPRLMSGKLEV